MKFGLGVIKSRSC